MKIATSWLDSPESTVLFDSFGKAGFRLLYVGGCVRNALLGVPASDLDLATDATPKVARAFLEADGFRVVPTGLVHGTITVLSGDVTYEITTFRRDVETTGRHARVLFTGDIATDASRRDFTINALYAERDGSIVDPLGGISDIDPPRIRFIGDAVSRIREDYLRSLRFFRFHARFSAPSEGFDAEALASISETLEGLDQLSRERVGSEVLGLLSTDDPVPALAIMAQIGVLPRILPGSDIRAMGPLVMLEQELGLVPDPLRRISVLGDLDLRALLRASKAQVRVVNDLRHHALGDEPTAALGYRLGGASGIDALLIRCAFLERHVTQADRNLVKEGAKAQFPIEARDVMPHCSGQQIGIRLRQLEADWIASGFSKSKRELLS